jgi:hypothetical protein
MVFQFFLIWQIQNIWSVIIMSIYILGTPTHLSIITTIIFKGNWEENTFHVCDNSVATNLKDCKLLEGLVMEVFYTCVLQHGNGWEY